MQNFLFHIFSIPTAFAQSSENSNVASKTSNQIQNLLDNIIGAIPLWITGFLVIGFSFIVARIVKSAVENKMTEQGIEEEHREVQIVAGRAASAVVLTIGITAGLKIAGLDLTSIIAAAAFGVGFALKDIIMNFLAGIIVLLQKQFTIGDWIKVNGTTGVIEQIQSRYTVIKKFDGTKVIIPNGDLFKKQVNSLTSNPFRRFSVNIAVDLYVDLKEAIDLIYKSIEKVDKIVKNPKPSIIVTQPGKFSNNLQVRCWVESKKGVLKATSALIRQIHKDFYKKGWAWPYPTEKIIFDKDVSPDVNARAKDFIVRNKKKKKLAGKEIVATVMATQPAPTQPAIVVNIDPQMPIVSAPAVAQPLPEGTMVAPPLPDVQPPSTPNI